MSNIKPDRKLTTNEERITERSGAALVELSRKNYMLGVANGSLNRIMVSFTDPGTVIAALVFYLTGTEGLIGVVITMRMLGINIPQIFMPDLVSSRRKKKVFYVISALSRSFILWGLFALMLGINNLNPLVIFGLLLLLFFVYSACVGIGMLSFMDIVAKTIPFYRRGTFYAWRFGIGGLLGFVAALLVRFILDEKRSGVRLSDAFMILMGFAAFFGTLATASFCFADEPDSPETSRRVGLLKQLRWSIIIVKADGNLRRFLLFKLCVGIMTCSLGFRAIYGVRVLGFSWAYMGYFIAAGVMGELSNVLLLGRTANRFGNRRVMIISSLGFTLLPLLIALASVVGPDTLFPGLRLWLYLFMFWVGGMASSGLGIGNMSYPLDIASQKRRANYLAVVYLFQMPLALLPALAGLLLRYIGYKGIFSIAFLGAVLSVVAASSLKEPRKALRIVPSSGLRN